jgi:hypothetical protein
MPIQAFGIFSAMVVPLVYLITICFQPLNYYFYEKYFNCYGKRKETKDVKNIPDVSIREENVPEESG